MAALAGAADMADKVEIANRATAAVVSTLRIRTSVVMMRSYKIATDKATCMQAY